MMSLTTFPQINLVSNTIQTIPGEHVLQVISCRDISKAQSKQVQDDSSISTNRCLLLELVDASQRVIRAFEYRAVTQIRQSELGHGSKVLVGNEPKLSRGFLLLQEGQIVCLQRSENIADSKTSNQLVNFDEPKEVVSVSDFKSSSDHQDHTNKPPHHQPHQPTSSYQQQRPTSSYQPHQPTSSYQQQRPTSSYQPHQPTSSYQQQPTSSYQPHQPTKLQKTTNYQRQEPLSLNLPPPQSDLPQPESQNKTLHFDWTVTQRPAALPKKSNRPSIHDFFPKKEITHVQETTNGAPLSQAPLSQAPLSHTAAPVTTPNQQVRSRVVERLIGLVGGEGEEEDPIVVTP